MTNQQRSQLAGAIRDSLISPNVCDSNLEPANVVDAIANGLAQLARSIDRLGNADAATPMGGLEGLGQAIIEGCGLIRDGLSDVASAITAAQESSRA